MFTCINADVTLYEILDVFSNEYYELNHLNREKFTKIFSLNKHYAMTAEKAIDFF